MQVTDDRTNLGGGITLNTGENIRAGDSFVQEENGQTYVNGRIDNQAATYLGDGAWLTENGNADTVKTADGSSFTSDWTGGNYNNTAMANARNIDGGQLGLAMLGINASNDAPFMDG